MKFYKKYHLLQGNVKTFWAFISSFFSEHFSVFPFSIDFVDTKFLSNFNIFSRFFYLMCYLLSYILMCIFLIFCRFVLKKIIINKINKIKKRREKIKKIKNLLLIIALSPNALLIHFCTQNLQAPFFSWDGENHFGGFNTQTPFLAQKKRYISWLSRLSLGKKRQKEEKKEGTLSRPFLLLSTKTLQANTSLGPFFAPNRQSHKRRKGTSGQTIGI